MSVRGRKRESSGHKRVAAEAIEGEEEEGEDEKERKNGMKKKGKKKEEEEKKGGGGGNGARGGIHNPQATSKSQNKLAQPSK